MSVIIKCYRGGKDKEGDPISNALITTENQAVAVGKRYLDDPSKGGFYLVRRYNLTGVHKNAAVLPGEWVSIEITNVGISKNVKVKEYKININADSIFANFVAESYESFSVGIVPEEPGTPEEPGYSGTGASLGYIGGGSSSKTMMRLEYAVQVPQTIASAELSLVKDHLEAVGHSNIAGYFSCGIKNFITLSDTDKLTYADETTVAVPSANLSTAKHSMGAVSNGETKGYFAGGVIVFTNIIENITYAFDTSAVITATLTGKRYGCGSVSSLTTGYFAGGRSSSTELATTDKFNFSDETVSAVPAANLSAPRYYVTGVNYTDIAGYYAGGDLDPVVTDLIDKLVFSTETTAALTSTTLSVERHSATGISNGLTLGFFISGSSSSGSIRTTEKLDFIGEVITLQSSAELLVDKSSAAGVNNGVV